MLTPSRMRWVKFRSSLDGFSFGDKGDDGMSATSETVDSLSGQRAVFTTGEAAKICMISQQTIIRCFDSGALTGFKVPRSRFRRIPRANLVEFMRVRNIPSERLTMFDKAQPLFLLKPEVVLVTPSVPTISVADLEQLRQRLLSNFGQYLVVELLPDSLRLRLSASLGTLEPMLPEITAILMSSTIA